MDAAMRSIHGIYDFTDDPDCVLRIASGHASHGLTLSDGTAIAEGEPVGALHLWNEHLPRYSDRGPDVAWACEMRRRMLHSMRLLTAYVEREPGWQSVRAFYAATMLSNRLGDRQIRRLAGRYPNSVLRRLHPVVIIAAFVFGAMLFGVVGLLLAMPAAMRVKIGLEHYYAEPIRPREGC
jgi:hypothetical protein